MTIAVTGPFASGKSTFVGMLGDLGAHTASADEIVRSGDEVDARIIDVDAKRRRLSLSLRPKREEREERAERPPRQREDRPARREDRADRGSDRGRGTSEGSGLRTGAFDALSDLDLEEK